MKLARGYPTAYRAGAASYNPTPLGGRGFRPSFPANDPRGAGRPLSGQYPLAKGRPKTVPGAVLKPFSNVPKSMPLKLPAVTGPIVRGALKAVPLIGYGLMAAELYQMMAKRDEGWALSPGWVQNWGSCFGYPMNAWHWFSGPSPDYTCLGGQAWSNQGVGSDPSASNLKTLLIGYSYPPNNKKRNIAEFTYEGPETWAQKPYPEYQPARAPAYVPFSVPEEWAVPQLAPEVLPIGVPVPAPRPVPWRHVPNVRPSPYSPTRRQTGPRPNPRTHPNPRPDPKVKPWTPPTTDWKFSPGKVPVVEPGHHFLQPPSGGTKERKAEATRRQMAGIMGVINAVTEGVDLVKAVYKALPKKYQHRGATVPEMLQTIYRHADEIDMADVISNILGENQMDRYYGKLGSINADASKRLGFLAGISSGPLH